MGIAHLSSYITGPTDFVWSPSGCTVSYTNSTTTSIIGGTVTWVPGGDMANIPPRTATFTFSQIFP